MTPLQRLLYSETWLKEWSRKTPVSFELHFSALIAFQEHRQESLSRKHFTPSYDGTVKENVTCRGTRKEK
jgi:hypothetical protein